MSKNKKMEIIAPLAIDFGAANSGVVSYTYSSGNLLNEPDTVKKGYLFKVGDIQFSQRNRLARRHQRRGIKRRQMARRLIFLILKDYFKIDEIKPETAVFIQSLIRRRGFTYLTEELDESVIKNADPEFLYAEFPEIFSKKSGESVLEQLLNVASDADKLTKALNDQWIQADKKTLEKHIKEKYPDADKDLINTYKELHGQIKNYTEKVYKAVKEGHKTRKEYFKSIRADIENNWKTLKELHTEKPHKLTADGFANLIGNISNLQLRVIRKYFNTPVDPKTGKPVESPDVFYPEKLGIKIRKWVRSWHIDKKADEIKIQKEVYLSLKGKEKNIIEILMSMDPDKTIPPYEDMNNRRIPACQSMILDPINLNKHYPDWREWTKALAAEFEREWVAECSIENFGIHYNSEIRIADQKKNGKVKLKKKEWEDEKEMKKTSEDMAKIQEFLVKNSPDLTAFAPKEWDEETSSFVKDAISSIIPIEKPIITNIYTPRKNFQSSSFL